MSWKEKWKNFLGAYHLKIYALSCRYWGAWRWGLQSTGILTFFIFYWFNSSGLVLAAWMYIALLFLSFLLIFLDLVYGSKEGRLQGFKTFGQLAFLTCIALHLSGFSFVLGFHVSFLLGIGLLLSASIRFSIDLYHQIRMKFKKRYWICVLEEWTSVMMALIFVLNQHSSYVSFLNMTIMMAFKIICLLLRQAIFNYNSFIKNPHQVWMDQHTKKIQPLIKKEKNKNQNTECNQSLKNLFKKDPLDIGVNGSESANGDNFFEAFQNQTGLNFKGYADALDPSKKNQISENSEEEKLNSKSFNTLALLIDSTARNIPIGPQELRPNPVFFSFFYHIDTTQDNENYRILKKTCQFQLNSQAQTVPVLLDAYCVLFQFCLCAEHEKGYDKGYNSILENGNVMNHYIFKCNIQNPFTKPWVWIQSVLQNIGLSFYNLNELEEDVTKKSVAKKNPWLTVVYWIFIFLTMLIWTPLLLILSPFYQAKEYHLGRMQIRDTTYISNGSLIDICYLHLYDRIRGFEDDDIEVICPFLICLALIAFPVFYILQFILDILGLDLIRSKMHHREMNEGKNPTNTYISCNRGILNRFVQTLIILAQAENTENNPLGLLIEDGKLYSKKQINQGNEQEKDSLRIQMIKSQSTSNVQQLNSFNQTVRLEIQMNKNFQNEWKGIYERWSLYYDSERQQKTEMTTKKQKAILFGIQVLKQGENGVKEFWSKHQEAICDDLDRLSAISGNLTELSLLEQLLSHGIYPAILRTWMNHHALLQYIVQDPNRYDSQAWEKLDLTEKIKFIIKNKKPDLKINPKTQPEAKRTHSHIDSIFRDFYDSPCQYPHLRLLFFYFLNERCLNLEKNLELVRQYFASIAPEKHKNMNLEQFKEYFFQFNQPQQQKILFNFLLGSDRAAIMEEDRGLTLYQKTLKHEFLIFFQICVSLLDNEKEYAESLQADLQRLIEEKDQPLEELNLPGTDEERKERSGILRESYASQKTLKNGPRFSFSSFQNPSQEHNSNQNH